jgi:hypothetical protein
MKALQIRDQVRYATMTANRVEIGKSFEDGK